ncbi:hypothetical protein PR202_ga12948 [Eleusine coracana subsp. coracana]|uniref:Uncharacterized protein n=1 Tax=Eleusine coracana subsp. coracana TaxID=191504 RepID=A0AAV5CDI5_ELECO|nr:hypothetical protein PR202_ga12948 [Eleusine coracana subsp. coracana]
MADGCRCARPACSFLLDLQHAQRAAALRGVATESRLPARDSSYHSPRKPPSMPLLAAPPAHARRSPRARVRCRQSLTRSPSYHARASRHQRHSPREPPSVPLPSAPPPPPGFSRANAPTRAVLCV